MSFFLSYVMRDKHCTKTLCVNDFKNLLKTKHIIGHDFAVLSILGPNCIRVLSQHTDVLSTFALTPTSFSTYNWLTYYCLNDPRPRVTSDTS